MMRIGFWGMLYHNYNSEPPKNRIGYPKPLNFLNSYITHLQPQHSRGNYSGPPSSPSGTPLGRLASPGLTGSRSDSDLRLLELAKLGSLGRTASCARVQV